jgi:hypothetical protein
VRAWIAVLVLVSPTVAVAQSGYDQPLGHVRAYSGVIGAFAPGELNAYGIGGVFEPKAIIWDYLVLGVRVDGAAMVGLDATDVNQARLALRICGAAMLKGELLLFPGEVRPFIGVGIGYYAAALLSGGVAGGASSLTGTGPGIMPQIGVDLGWFRAAAQYHLILGDLGAANYLAIELAWRVY